MQGGILEFALSQRNFTQTLQIPASTNALEAF
jgi:hypothetical protein